MQSAFRVADVSLWLRLLSVGDAMYITDELSAYRLHKGQEQYKPDIAIKCLTERFTLLEDGRSLGFLADGVAYSGAARNLLEIIRNTIISKRFPDQYTPTLSRLQLALEEVVKH